MINKALIEIIRKRRAGGLTDEQIRATLVNAGYSDSDINGNIEASYKEPSYVEEKIKEEKPKKKNWWPF